jgi:ABC-type polysaccharide/polyol phosphate transport system ATPase subunit
MGAIELKGVWKEYSFEREKELTLKERFVNLGKRRGTEKIVALKDINLDIENGECFGILGKNGSGKTTLLKIIAGILKPNKGLVKVTGRIIPILTLGLGFQKELTAKENVYLYASVLGLNKKKIEEVYDKIVEFSELNSVMDVKLKDFSDGMVMRLSFSIAFHVDADIILIDETLTVGDAAFQTKCLQRIRELKEMGKTIIIVLHSTADIRRFCDRALILENGGIIFFGQASEVCEKYDEIIESERLKRFNEAVMRESGIGFKARCEDAFILKKGKECTMELRIDQLPSMVELFFEGKSSVSVFSKNIDNGKMLFQTKSLPIPKGEYNVWVRHEGKFLSAKSFKILVKEAEESRENKTYILSDSSSPFQGITIVFGENAEHEAKMFEDGKTVFVFRNLEEIVEPEGKACLFNGNELLLSDKTENVMNELNGRIWKNLAVKHFNDILVNTQLGKTLLGIL